MTITERAEAALKEVAAIRDGKWKGDRRAKYGATMLDRFEQLALAALSDDYAGFGEILEQLETARAASEAREATLRKAIEAEIDHHGEVLALRDRPDQQALDLIASLRRALSGEGQEAA